MLDHLAIQVADVGRATTFYDAVLRPLGGSRLMAFGPVVAYGVDFPSFWLGPEQVPGAPRQEAHIAFRAPDRAAVDAFFATAVEGGAEVLHEPREWPEYHPGYYGAFVRDPDGNNVEAVHHGTG